MIMYYFSGTGNSTYIAELFCRKMDAERHSIEENLDATGKIISEDIIGFCYPVYGSRVPKLMREFAARYLDALRNNKSSSFVHRCFSPVTAQGLSLTFFRLDMLM
jgi:hypothetical protein